MSDKSSLIDLLSMAEPKPELRLKIIRGVEKLTDICFKCMKCTSGCTSMRLLELKPHIIANLVRMGFVDELVSSTMIWDCSLCLKCKERCPQEVSPVDIILALRCEAVVRGLEAPEEYRSMLTCIMENGLAYREKKRVVEGVEYDRVKLGLPKIKGPKETFMNAMFMVFGEVLG